MIDELVAIPRPCAFNEVVAIITMHMGVDCEFHKVRIVLMKFAMQSLALRQIHLKMTLRQCPEDSTRNMLLNCELCMGVEFQFRMQPTQDSDLTFEIAMKTLPQIMLR